MAILGFEIEEIARLLELLQTQGLEEIVLEEEGRYIRIRGPRPEKRVVSAPPVETAPPPPAAAPPAPRAERRPRKTAPPKALPPADQIELVAPMVGIFYRADKPGAKPFFEVGDMVKVGDIIGIIEAMKIFSEIPAEHAGVIVAIPATDGQLVQAGAPLMLLKRGG